MKKLWLLGCIGLFFACNSTPKSTATQRVDIDELDLACRDASNYLNDNITAGSKIVILNVESDFAAVSDYIIDELIANAVNDRIFDVVDRRELDSIRDEQNFQWDGEVDDNRALAVGRFFEAQTIVSGKVSQINNRYRMTIRALEVQTARVQGQYNRDIERSNIIAAIVKEEADRIAAADKERRQARTKAIFSPRNLLNGTLLVAGVGILIWLLTSGTLDVASAN